MRSIVLHLRTKHDINGNPRRLFLPLNPNKFEPVTSVIEEGYSSKSKVTIPKGVDGYVIVPVEVPVSEYNDWIKWAKDSDCYVE